MAATFAAIRPLAAAVARARALASRHPRHFVLTAFVAGLLLGPLGASATVLGLLAASALAGRPELLAVAGIAVLAGAGIAAARLHALDAGVLGSLQGRAIAPRATLLEPIRQRAGGPAVARARLLDGPGAGEQVVLRIRSYAHDDRPWPQVGDQLRVRGTLAPLGQYDAYQRRRNAHAALDVTRLDRTEARRGGIAGALDGVRRRAERGLEQRLAAPEQALLRGMVLGEDERLSDPVERDFQRAGLAHILAVSGENVMLLATLVLFAGAALGVDLRLRLLVALALIAIYVPLAGGGPSIQRAGVMGVAGLVAALAGRPASRWYALALAAAATLILNPRAAGEPGWQLSFAAVVALLIGVAPLRTALAPRLPGIAVEATAISLAATLGTAPLMALQFQQVSLASLAANLLAAPAIAPVMWLGMLAAAVAQVAPALAAPFTLLAGPLLVFIASVAHVCAAAPLAAVPVAAPPWAIAAGSAALGVGAMLVLRRWRRRPPLDARPLDAPPLDAPSAGATVTALRADAGGPRRSLVARIRWARVATLAALAAAPLAGAAHLAAAARPSPLAPGELVVSFLDVGQGDATLIQLDGTSLLVDTGVPDGPIEQRLAEAGVDDLDALLLTHAESDHEGAALDVIERHRPRLVLDGGAGWPSPVQRGLPAALALVHAHVHVPQAGETIAIGPLRLRVLWPTPLPPGATPSGNPNERAVVARLEAIGFSLLLTADAESDVTGPLAPQPVDALKVAHHGSDDPGLPALLARLHPRVAAIEVGRHNTYGHPAASTLAALRAVPTVVRTDRDGTVRLHVRGRQVWVEHG